MRYFIAVLFVLTCAAPSWAWVSRSVSRVVVREKVQVVQQVQVQKVVQVQQVVQQVKVAQVVTPVVQIQKVQAYAVPCYPQAYVAPVVAAYYGPPAAVGSERLDRLERSMQQLVEAQTQLIQRLTAPVKP